MTTAIEMRDARPTSEWGGRGIPPRYIFTVSTGRNGQNSLADFLAEHVPSACVAFEEPQVRPVLPHVLGTIERRLRRRFLETNELLGRGRVLAAFDSGDEAALTRFGDDRLRWIERRLEDSGAQVYIDVSKHFIHGLHRPLMRKLADVGLILLTRDPVLNMRSYLNRRKSFALDNNRPDSPQNCLRLEPTELSPGELYLWIWFETQLRFRKLVEEHAVSRVVELTTEDLNDAGALHHLMDTFGLAHEPVRLGAPKNTNIALGYGATRVTRDDIVLFECFLARLPEALLRKIPYLEGYDARRANPDAR